MCAEVLMSLYSYSGSQDKHLHRCRVTVAEHTRKNADKALAALHYEERCQVHQLVEPMTTAGFLAMAGTDTAFGGSATPPGVAVITMYSQCTSLSVQASSKHTLTPPKHGPVA